MVASSRNRLAVLAPLFLLPPSLLAQGHSTGRVVRISAGDTLPVGGLAVVLHRVGRASQGPIDSVTSDAGGRFAFRFSVDTTAAYLLSVRYHGIEYFSAPLASNGTRPDTAVVLIVADTSSAAPVATRERTLLVSRADEAGSRTVVDWLVLVNAGERTRVAPDSSRPSWGAALPPDAQNVELADPALSQFSSEALEFRRDSVLLFAPLSPGRKELVLQYRIPGGLRRFAVPLPAGLDSVFVLLEETGARVVAPALVAQAVQQLDGRPFRRWAGKPGAAARLELAFPAAAVSPRLLLALLLGLLASGVLALVLLLRARRVRVTTPHPDVLVDAIARLDAAWEEQGGPSDPAAEERYLAERARLKAALLSALAGPRRHS